MLQVQEINYKNNLQFKFFQQFSIKSPIKQCKCQSKSQTKQHTPHVVKQDESNHKPTSTQIMFAHWCLHDYVDSPRNENNTGLAISSAFARQRPRNVRKSRRKGNVFINITQITFWPHCHTTHRVELKRRNFHFQRLLNKNYHLKL